MTNMHNMCKFFCQFFFAIGHSPGHESTSTGFGAGFKLTPFSPFRLRCSIPCSKSWNENFVICCNNTFFNTCLSLQYGLHFSIQATLFNTWYITILIVSVKITCRQTHILNTTNNNNNIET